MNKKTIDNRLKRLVGQVESLRTSIANETPCDVVLPQFLAVKGAFNAAFEEYVKLSLSECDLDNQKKRDQLISMLLKK